VVAFHALSGMDTREGGLTFAPVSPVEFELGAFGGLTGTMRSVNGGPALSPAASRVQESVYGSH